MSRCYAPHSCNSPECSACNSAAEWAEIERDFPEVMSAGEERRMDDWAEKQMEAMWG